MQVIHCKYGVLEIITVYTTHAKPRNKTLNHPPKPPHISH